MAPVYNPDLRSERSADVLVFTSNLVTRAEFTAWQSLFQALKLTVDYWDVEKYGGISGTPQAAAVDWVGRYHTATLLLLHAKEFLALFKPRDLLTHFFGPSDSVKSAAPWSESSLILHGVSRPLFFLLVSFSHLPSQLDAGETAPLMEALFRDGARGYHFVGGEFCGTHIVSEPEAKHAVKRAEQILLELRKEDPLYHYRTAGIQLKIERERAGK